MAPDRCLIDLDPGDDVPFSRVVALAREVARIAEACGLTVALKTSGASGIHIVLPLPPRTSYETSAALALGLAGAVVAAVPEYATLERGIKARPKGSIYVDALQNARGKSMSPHGFCGDAKSIPQTGAAVRSLATRAIRGHQRKEHIRCGGCALRSLITVHRRRRRQ